MLNSKEVNMKIYLFLVLFFIPFSALSISLDEHPLGRAAKNGNIIDFNKAFISLNYERLREIVEKGETQLTDDLFKIMVKVESSQHEFALKMEDIAKQIKLRDPWLLDDIMSRENQQGLSLQDVILQKKINMLLMCI